MEREAGWYWLKWKRFTDYSIGYIHGEDWSLPGLGGIVSNSSVERDYTVGPKIEELEEV